MTPPLFILAANAPAARASARELGLPPSPGAKWRYLTDPVALRGCQAVRVHYGEGWREHPRQSAIRYALSLIYDVEIV